MIKRRSLFFREIGCTICLILATVGCDYKQDLEELNNRMESLRELVRQINSDIQTLSSLVDAIQQNNDWVTSIETVYEGDVVTGTMINFVHRESIFIANGKNGEKGDRGKDGADGIDGGIPLISLKQDTDGVWYWTLNGDWLLNDKGERVIARGSDGVIPLVKMDSGKWWVSYDSGASWSYVGEVVDYSKYFFPNYGKVSIIDGTTCEVVLNNGQKIYLPLWVEFDVRFPFGNTYYLSENKELMVLAIIDPVTELEINSVCDEGLSVESIEILPTGLTRILIRASEGFIGGNVKIVFEKGAKLFYKQLRIKTLDSSDRSITDVILSDKAIDLAKGCTKQLYASVVPENDAYQNIIWSSDYPWVAEVDGSGLVTAKSAGHCVVTAMAHNGVFGVCLVTVSSQTGVDLGLSVKWAECNVGAVSASDPGNYFAWGESVPRTDEFAGFYYWETYLFSGGSSHTLTRYNTLSSYGTVDNLTTLTSSDDAASVQWKDSWRLPTSLEWAELYDNCTWEWLEKGDKSGYISSFTAQAAGYLIIKGGVGSFSLDREKFIFLPSCGCYKGNYVEENNVTCHYWSSSLYIQHPDCAIELSAGPLSIQPQYGAPRCYGMTVRPVMK